MITVSRYRHPRSGWYWSVPLAALLGCSSTMPSPELLEARQAYDRARLAPHSSLVPADVLYARQALERAERAYADDPGSFDELAFAYVARRRAEQVVARGEQAVSLQRKAAAEQSYATLSRQLRERAQAEAAAAAVVLAATQDRLAQTQRLLAGVSKVSEERRGLVLTLDGSVLFAFGKSEILPPARERLSRVAEALALQGPSARIVVEGHTDSIGTSTANLQLSQERAQAVRAFLVDRGVPNERITAVGKGESQPLVANDTPEDRANNRRVEIVVQ